MRNKKAIKNCKYKNNLNYRVAQYQSGIHTSLAQDIEQGVTHLQKRGVNLAMGNGPEA